MRYPLPSGYALYVRKSGVSANGFNLIDAILVSPTGGCASLENHETSSPYPTRRIGAGNILKHILEYVPMSEAVSPEIAEQLEEHAIEMVGLCKLPAREE